MTTYAYKEGKKRIKDILNNKMDIEKQEIPKDDNFTFKNGYLHYVSAIFIDIRDSTTLFSEEDKEKVAKIIRSFTSEVIEILRKDDNLREIGIRGDCVYAIYKTPKKNDIYEICNMAFFINTFMKMLNKLLTEKNYINIEVGIGIGTAEELVVKAGRKDTGINNKVWIGDAVTKASNLSSLGNKGSLEAIVMSEITYNNVIDILVKKDGEKSKKWFTKRSTISNGTYYDCDIVKLDFDKWIDNEMPD